MFCLPYPPDSVGIIPPIEVPYVAKYNYDFSLPNLFENFARECRFDSYNDRHPDELASLMQSWLFFGLISEIVGQHVDHEFIVRSRGQISGQETRFIDSRLDEVLDHRITDRFMSLRAKPKDQRAIIWSEIRERIRSAKKHALVFEKVCWCSLSQIRHVSSDRASQSIVSAAGLGDASRLTIWADSGRSRL